MRKWMLMLAVLCIAAGTAMADVSNEVIVGLEGDSTSEWTGPNGEDLTDTQDTSNSLFIVQYTHFFAPLKEDDRPIELRRFYQHPSTLSAGLAFFGSTDKDTTTPSDAETGAAMLLLGGEYYFPTNTGLFLNIGSGSGTTQVTSGGTVQPDEDLKIGSVEFGVRQYLVPEAEVHLRIEGESTETTQPGLPTSTSDKSVVFFGGRGVIKDVVGLLFEFGGGEREDESGGFTIKYDVAAVNIEVAGYIGKQLSVRLGIEAEEEDMQGAPAGIEHTTTTGRTTLAARYWFSERFGMELPLYAETTELKTVVSGVGESKETRTNSGIGLYAAFRF
jgi:hypothetical protein